MFHGLRWGHVVAFGGVLMSITLPILLMQDEYELVEVEEFEETPEESKEDSPNDQ